MITLKYLTFILIIILAIILGTLGGVILGLRWKKKDDFMKRQDSMAATIMTTGEGTIAMIVVDGCIVPHVQFVNMDELLNGETIGTMGEGEYDDEI